MSNILLSQHEPDLTTWIGKELGLGYGLGFEHVTNVKKVKAPAITARLNKCHDTKTSTLIVSRRVREAKILGCVSGVLDKNQVPA